MGILWFICIKCINKWNNNKEWWTLLHRRLDKWYDTTCNTSYYAALDILLERVLNDTENIVWNTLLDKSLNG